MLRTYNMPTTEERHRPVSWHQGDWGLNIIVIMILRSSTPGLYRVQGPVESSFLPWKVFSFSRWGGWGSEKVGVLPHILASTGDSSDPLSSADTLQDPQWMPEPQQAPNPLYTMFLFMGTFHLKEALYSFSSAWPSCQPRVTWAQALWYHDSRSDNPDGYWVTSRQGVEMLYISWKHWTKGRVTS